MRCKNLGRFHMVKEFVKFTWPVACTGPDHKGTLAESKRDVSLFGKGKGLVCRDVSPAC